VNELFGKTDQFNDGARHPKWAEFDVRTDIPGWTRFKPAANWIAAHEPVAVGNQPGTVQEIVEKLLENYQGSGGRKLISANEKDFIVKEVVKQIRDKQSSTPPNR
jgi:hypothetical protein